MKAVDIFSMFAVNETKANEGVWVPFMGDIEFLIGRELNHKFREVAKAANKRYERLLKQDTPEAEAKGLEVTIDILARSVLLDWRDPNGELTYKGQPIGSYSVEKAKQLLSLEGFRQWVQEQSRDEKIFKEVEDKEDEKN